MVGEIPALLTVIISLAILMMTAYRSLRTLMAALMLLLDRMGISRRLKPHLPLGIITQWRELQTHSFSYLDGRVKEEGETKLGWSIAGGFGNFFQAPFFWIINQRWHLHFTLWILAFMFAFISGILITGLLGKAVKEYLIKAGVPTTF